MVAINTHIQVPDCTIIHSSSASAITTLNCPCPEGYVLHSVKSVLVSITDANGYANCYQNTILYQSTAALIGAILNPYLAFHKLCLPQDFAWHMIHDTNISIIYQMLSGITFLIVENIICREASPTPTNVYELVRECYIQDESSE